MLKMAGLRQCATFDQVTENDVDMETLALAAALPDMVFEALIEVMTEQEENMSDPLRDGLFMVKMTARVMDRLVLSQAALFRGLLRLNEGSA